MVRWRSVAITSIAMIQVNCTGDVDTGPLPSPPPRSAFGLVHHESLGGLLLVAGSDSTSTRLADTWLFDGEGWRPVPAPGLPPRSDFQIAYDAARDRTVVFGGSSGSGRLGDTWTFDGERWERVADDGPRPRALGAMAYDPVRERVVLFGGSGEDRERLGDTWEWDGSVWTEVTPEGESPSGRGAHAMTWDPVSASVVLYGGWDDSVTGTDLWSWSGTAWVRLDDGGPARLHLALAADPDRGRLVLFGGFGEGREGDTWVWDGGSWTRVATSGPPARAEHEGAFLPGLGVVVYGGITGQSMAVEDRTKAGDLWSWDGAGWSRHPR